MKKKKIIRALRGGACGLMSFLTAFSAVGCSCAGGTPPPQGYELWGAPSTEKILRDRDDYASLKTEAKVEIDTAQNEYESAQIVISAVGKIKEYTVTLSDLTMEDGEKTYSASNITVYNMKYTNVTSAWTPNAVTGWYPDAILPFDAAVKAGENTVAAGDNQSIYFSFNTPMGQPAGKYKGNITLTVDGEENIIPVSVNVRNISVSETVHTKSMFINNWSQYLGEYGDTQALMEEYIKKLFEYRLAPTTLVLDGGRTQEDMEYYAEKAYELCANESCSNFGIPTYKNTSGIPDGILSGYLREIAKKSLEKNYDLVAKVTVYGIDEPVVNDAFDKTKEFALDFEAQIQELVSELEDEKETYLAEYPEASEEFYEQIIESVKGVRYITTTAYRDSYDPYVDVWCPPFNSFESGYAAGVYPEEEEVWWYGAVSPKAPYPTYHLDDVMLSPRVLGWMQNIYGVEGNIYWAVNVYASYNGKYEYVDEYYEDPSHYYSANGDGFLFYPGKKYGIEGPLASLRLESIRDGYEEYELMYAIQEKYAQIGETAGMKFSPDATLEDIASSLYSGMTITATTANFNEARKQLLNLAEFTESGICFIGYNDDGEGLIEYELYVPDGATLNVTGAGKTNERVVTGGRIHTYTADMRVADAAREASFSTTVNGETVTVQRKLSGTVSLYEAETLVGAFTEGVIAEQTKAVDGLSITGATCNLLQIALPAAETDSKQKITFAQQAILEKMTAETEKVVFNFWFDGEEESYPVEVYAKYQKRYYMVSLLNVRFKHGWNSVEWKGLPEINWTTNGAVEKIVFSLGSNGATARSDIYLKSIAIYSAKEGS